MASELRVNTLKDASGNNSVGMSTVAEGSAKAWINFNGDNTSDIRDSFNCGSMTDGGSGDHTVNYTNSLGNTGYAAMTQCQTGDSSNPAVANPNTQGTNLTGSTRILTFENPGAFDSLYMALTAHGDLA